MSVPTQNDCTGDYLLSKAATDNYRDNYDAIFGKKVKSEVEVVPIKKESKSMNDKMREEFEVWFLDNYSWFIQNKIGRYSLVRYKDSPHQYEETRAHHDWRVWQASRAVLVVELPKLSKVEGCHGVEDVWFPEDIIAAIESTSLGLRIK